MGCNRLGDPGTDNTQWFPLVARALELGVTFFDTSNSYNQGRSEAILGKALAAVPRSIVVSTKVGTPVGSDSWSRREFSAKTILTEVEESLKRLRLQTIDLYMLHSPSVQHLDGGDWAGAIQKLRDEGKIRYFGISTDDQASGIRAIQYGADFLQVEYNLLFPTAEDELLPLAQERSVGIMVRIPMARGLLTGKFRAGEAIPPDQQWRRPAGDQLELRLQRVEQLRFLERPGQTLGQASIRFVLSHPAVHCAIPGARTIAQLEQNLAADEADLTPEDLARIGELHEEWRATGNW
jgi:myo-inositol catabolism protein IolS